MQNGDVAIRYPIRESLCKAEGSGHLPWAFLSCPGKKGSKEAGWGGFELCAPAPKATSPDPTRRALSMVQFAGVLYKSLCPNWCSYPKEIETESFRDKAQFNDMLWY